METPLSFEASETSFELYERLNSVLRSLEMVMKNLLQLAENFEIILRRLMKALSNYPPPINLNTPQQNYFVENKSINNLPSMPSATKNVINNLSETDVGIEPPSVSGLHEIAGLKSIKNTLYMLVVLPKRQPQLYHNIKSSCSVLLYGPPGTGKTRLVHGLAAESGAVFHSLSVGNLLSSYVGQTEKNIRNIFNYLRTTENYSLLFIDEIDGLCRSRSSSESDHSRRVKTELMCQLTKMENCRNAVIIAATNCPWDLDTAILRRFQKRIYVPLPTEEERLELFQILTKNTHIVQTPEQFNQLIRICEGYSGSDIASLVQDALHMPLADLGNINLWMNTADGFFEPIIEELNDNARIELSELKDLPPGSVRSRPVTVTDFLEAAKNIQVTVTAEDLMKYEQFRNKK